MNEALLAFCVRSLYRECGTGFLTKVILRHPVATLGGIARYTRRETSDEGEWRGGRNSLVGLGFCLKPVSPPCPSGRPNHRCEYFESRRKFMSVACGNCLIRTLGGLAFEGGSPLYIMTSAGDILTDVLLPALERQRFTRALLTMCRYSFEPIRLAMEICGVEARLTPFEHGDCRDYATWRRADTGSKPEQTVLARADLAALTGALSAASMQGPPRSVRLNGNIFEPDQQV